MVWPSPLDRNGAGVCPANRARPASRIDERTWWLQAPRPVLASQCAASGNRAGSSEEYTGSADAISFNTRSARAVNGDAANALPVAHGVEGNAGKESLQKGTKNKPRRVQSSCRIPPAGNLFARVNESQSSQKRHDDDQDQSNRKQWPKAELSVHPFSTLAYIGVPPAFTTIHQEEEHPSFPRRPFRVATPAARARWAQMANATSTTTEKSSHVTVTL
ncbi:hypothetical protein HPB50_007973 [Hyalomma asiaticum]|uniref:Uncharacterized protein n=1 Tax=Hyalomma asiaticum TaxID=266040 RepID=A0ACB7T8G0_HYAAI|nr:hypothetical protein HPB50_007973 [Hyalomma asiaticum]